MAAAYDTTSGAQTANSGPGSTTTSSWTHTPVGTPAAVIVTVAYSEDATSSGNITLTGITYGASAMTLLGSSTAAAQNFVIYYILTPAAGAQTVTVSWANDDGLSVSHGTGQSTSFTSGGTITLSALTTATGTVTPMTQNLTGTSTSNVYHHMYGISDASSANITSVVGGTNETLRTGLTSYGASATKGQVQTTTQTSASGTVTPTATQSANRTWRLLSVELKEVLPSGHSLGALGVGN